MTLVHTLAPLFLAAFARQAPVTDRSDEGWNERTVFTGRVLLPDGRAARGALVTTSAGSSAVTDGDGSFTVAADVPLDAECVEVDASLERRDLAARVRIVPAALSTISSVGTLQLVPSGVCRTRWLPTFGGPPGTDGAVNVLVTFDDGGGPALYAGGSFQKAGGVSASRVAVDRGPRLRRSQNRGRTRAHERDRGSA